MTIVSRCRSISRVWFGSLSVNIHQQREASMSSLPSSLVSSSKLVLYSFWGSSCSWRVRFGLKLKGLSYEYRAVNLNKGEQHTPEFDQLNPLHYVPVLVDGDVVIADSFAILLHLEEMYPQRRLLPADPKERALHLQVASVVGSSIQPRHMLGLVKKIEEKLGQEEKRLWVDANIGKGLQALEKLLNGSVGRYATGDNLYLGDVFLGPQLTTVIARFDVDLSKYPTLNRLYELYKTVPEFIASSPEQQPDADP